MWLDVADGVLCDALRHHLGHAEIAEAREPVDGCAIVTDRLCATATVVVVESTPAASRRALDHVATGSAASLLPLNDPRAVVAVLIHLRGGVFIDERVLALAAAMPALSPRQWALLEELMAVHNVSVIARRLDISEATVKRELRELGDLLSAGSRAELQLRAAELGIHSRGGAPFTR